MADRPRQDLLARSFAFVKEILDRYPRLASGGPAHEHMALQLFKAASSLGANLEEGQVANSRRDMANKYAVALREVRESHYWLRLFATDSKWTEELAPLIAESREFIAMLTTSVRNLRKPL